jgi:hypothetical protein
VAARGDLLIRNYVEKHPNIKKKHFSQRVLSRAQTSSVNFWRVDTQRAGRQRAESIIKIYCEKASKFKKRSFCPASAKQRADGQRQFMTR